MRAILCSSLLTFACGTNGGGNNQDLAVPPDMHAPPGADLACDNSMPSASACGHQCDSGNSIGVGKFCTGTMITDPNCPSTAPICSHGPMPNTYFCTTTCTACTSGTCVDTAKCAEGTLCQCNAALGGCGCVPATCVAMQG